jgi:hypothetical protein
MMIDAQDSIILGRSLSAAENDRLRRLEGRLADVFGAAGHTIRVCERNGEGEGAVIRFIAGLTGPSVVSIPAAEFAIASDAEIVRAVEGELSNLPRRP